MNVKMPHPVSPALQKVLNYYHSARELAIALKIQVPSIYGWRSLPEARAYQIEILTRGKLRAAKLLADNVSPTGLKRRSEGGASVKKRREGGNIMIT